MKEDFRPSEIGRRIEEKEAKKSATIATEKDVFLEKKFRKNIRTRKLAKPEL